MTPFAVTQRAARLATELERKLADVEGLGRDEARFSTEDVLQCLYRAGLTLDADLTEPSDVKAALERLGVEVP